MKNNKYAITNKLCTVDGWEIAGNNLTAPALVFGRQEYKTHVLSKIAMLVLFFFIIISSQGRQ